MRWFMAFALSFTLSAPCFAETPKTVEDDFGVLNPEDTGVAMIKRKIAMGVIDSVTCSLGINATKTSDHVLARKLTKQCAEAGYTKAMTWMSQLEDNGMGGAYDPVASAAIILIFSPRISVSTPHSRVLMNRSSIVPT